MDDNYFTLKKRLLNSDEPMSNADIIMYRMLKLHYQRKQGNAQDICFIIFTILGTIACFCLYFIAIKPA